jgi:hypothetical protein
MALLILFTGVFTFHLLLLRQNISAREEELRKTEHLHTSYGTQNAGFSADLLRVVSHIKGGQPRWGTNLQILAALLPPEMWLTEISLAKEKKQGRQRDILKVSGSTVVSKGQSGLSVILEYLNALRGDERFSEDFESVKLLSSKRSGSLDREELNFDFTCLVRR